MTNALFNSAALYGIQLVQLQIPKRSIEQIQDRLKDETCATVQYSDDCLTSADVGTHLTSEELTCLVEKTIDVGYICKKCHVVFPQVDACNAHQAALCFKESAPERRTSGDTVLKLEQKLYRCSPCKVNCATVKEFRAHCALERHGKANAGVADPGGSKNTCRNNSRLGTARQKQAESMVFKGGHFLSTTHKAELKLEDVV